MIRTPLFLPQRAVGATVMLLADCQLAWTMLVFGSWHLTARIGPTHELVTSGPFGLVRDPNDLAMNLLALGSFGWIPTPCVLVRLVAVAATRSAASPVSSAKLLRGRQFLMGRALPGSKVH